MSHLRFETIPTSQLRERCRAIARLIKKRGDFMSGYVKEGYLDLMLDINIQLVKRRMFAAATGERMLGEKD